jgi:hypothetical protein
VFIVINKKLTKNKVTKHLQKLNLKRNEKGALLWPVWGWSKPLPMTNLNFFKKNWP